MVAVCARTGAKGSPYAKSSAPGEDYGQSAKARLTAAADHAQLWLRSLASVQCCEKAVGKAFPIDFKRLV